jgi:hypothetical protein
MMHPQRTATKSAEPTFRTVPKSVVFGTVCAGAAKVGKEPNVTDAATLINVRNHESLVTKTVTK